MSGPDQQKGEETREPKQFSLSIANFLETEPTAPPTQPAFRVRRQAPTRTGQTAELSPTRQRLVRTETEPQMVLVRLLEDAHWIQHHARSDFKEAEGVTARLALLKLFWSVRTELVKLLQGLGVLPRELFFTEEETTFDELPTEVAETISGLLSGRLESH